MEKRVTGVSTNRHTDESWPNGNKGQFYLLDCVSIALRNEDFRAGKYVHLDNKVLIIALLKYLL